MSDTNSSSSRFRTELFSASSVVTLTAVVLAVVSAYITPVWAGGNTSIGVGALLSVGIGVPTLYREWGVRSSMSAAFLWTVVASAIVYGFYVIVFVFATRLSASADFSGFLALGLTVSLAIAFTLYRTRIV